MAKVFLDANILLDLLEKRTEISAEMFKEHDLFISTLSVHIVFYITKQKIPYIKLSQIIDTFSLITLSESICSQGLVGPISDFEDNVQLHSAASFDCDYFLTRDRKLLDMKFFGKAKIVSSLE